MWPFINHGIRSECWLNGRTFRRVGTIGRKTYFRVPILGFTMSTKLPNYSYSPTSCDKIRLRGQTTCISMLQVLE